MAAFELDPTPKEEWAKQVLYNHQPFDNSIHSGNKVIDPRVYFAIRNPSEQEMRSMLNGLSFETQYLGETQSTTRTQFKSNRRPSEAFGTPAVALSDILAARQTLSRSGLTPVDPSKPDVAQQQQNRVVEAYLAEADRLSVESKVSKPSEVSKLSEAAEAVEANPNDQTIAPQFEVRLGEGASSVSATQIDLGDIQANVPSLRPGAATAPVVELQPSRDSSLFLQPSLYEVPGLPSLSATPSPKVSSPVKAVQPVQPVKAVQPVQPAQPMPSASSTQPVGSMPSTQFMQPVPSTQPAQPVNLVSSMPSDHYGNPLTPASPLDSVKPLLPTSPSPPRLTPEAAPPPSLAPAPAEEAPILAGSIDLLQAPLAQPRAALDAQSTGAVVAGSDADLMAALLFGDVADRRLLQEPSEPSAFSAAPSAAGNLKDNLTANLKDNLTANLTSNATGNATSNATGNATANATKNTTVSQASNRRAEAVPAVPSPLYRSGSPASRPSTSSLAQSAGFSIGGVGLSGATDA